MLLPIVCLLLLVTTLTTGELPCINSSTCDDLHLFLARSFSILHMNGCGKVISGSLTRNVNAASLDYDKDSFALYWAQSSSLATPQICRKNLSRRGRNPTCIIREEDQTIPVQIAIDWAHDLLYWMTSDPSGHNDIRVSTMDGDHITTVVSGLTNAKGMTLDPIGGWIFWSSQGHVYRAGGDGSQARIIQTFLTRGMTSTDTLTFDLQTRRLLWAEEGINVFFSCLPDGTGLVRHVVSGSTIPSIVSMNSYGGTVYYLSQNNLYRLCTSTGQTEEIAELSEIATSLRVYDKKRIRKPDMTSCHSDCDYLCLPHPQDDASYSICRCPNDAQNGTSCEYATEVAKISAPELPVAAIAGIVLGVLLIVFVISVIVACIVRRRRIDERQEPKVPLFTVGYHRDPPRSSEVPPLPERNQVNIPNTQQCQVQEEADDDHIYMEMEMDKCPQQCEEDPYLRPRKKENPYVV